MFPGGNTCYGFYSFYDHIVPVTARNKIILKGGPGVGKSSFMKKIAEDFAARQIDLEYHWCSSDNNSLDGITAGNRQVCVLDGTAPHTVDPRYPGAIDRIINLGEYWDTDIIAANRENIVKLTDSIGLCFQRAYNRLAEARLALAEWKSYIKEATNTDSVNRNVLALGDDFLRHSPKSNTAPRHLFAAAITPEGIVTKAESLVENSFTVTAVKGSPGGGCQDLFKDVERIINLSGVFAEIYHCPFDPQNIDIIIIPENNSMLIDLSANIVDYEKILPVHKLKRFLDFDQFLEQSVLDPYAKVVASARERFTAGIQESIAMINAAKKYHDELENYYIPAMNFEAMDQLRKETVERLLKDLQN